MHPEILQSDLLPPYIRPIKSMKPHVGTYLSLTAEPVCIGPTKRAMQARRWAPPIIGNRPSRSPEALMLDVQQTAVKGKIRDSPHLFCATGKEPGLFGAERCSCASFRLRDFLTVLSWFPPHHASITRRKPLPMGGERIAKTPTSSLTGICGPFLVAPLTHRVVI